MFPELESCVTRARTDLKGVKLPYISDQPPKSSEVRRQQQQPSPSSVHRLSLEKQVARLLNSLTMGASSSKPSIDEPSASTDNVFRDINTPIIVHPPTPQVNHTNPI